MAVFRVERNRGYTVMSNHHLRNRGLTLKAKGLLSQMLSLPDNWDYTLAGLSHINREKIDAIREAVRELEKAGYIVRSRERDEKGRLRGADYIIYEQPQPPVLDLPTLENPTLDILACLDAVMKQNTGFYQSDFEIDKEIIHKAAASPDREDRTLLWLSRPSGTHCFRERDVFLKDTRPYNTWKFHGEQTRDRILAYAVELTGRERGKIRGNLYELDYAAHFRHVREQALPADIVTLFYERGERSQPTNRYLGGSPDPQYGAFLRFEVQPNVPEALRDLLQEERRSREQLSPGDFKAHIAALRDGLIEAEARRIVAEMKRQCSPNSPNKTHYMTELAPAFMMLASSRDVDRLFSLLPYKTLTFSKIEGRHGTYALIDKNENRDRDIRKPRPSIRAQLAADKKKAAPKRAAKTKHYEMEV